MKITICGSMSFAQKFLEICEELSEKHELILPEGTREYASGKLSPGIDEPSHKINNDLIRDHYHKIASSDAVLVVNHDKDGIANYVGGNAFLEMGFAHVLHKKIFLLNPIPQMRYKDEIIAMQPVILNGDFSKII